MTIDQARIRRVSDGVVASYIHDISARTGSGPAPATARRSGGQVHRTDGATGVATIGSGGDVERVARLGRRREPRRRSLRVRRARTYS